MLLNYDLLQLEHPNIIIGFMERLGLTAASGSSEIVTLFCGSY